MILAVDFNNLHEILRSLYNEMMPLCERMTGVAQGVAGLGALFFIANKVWQSLARAESIDVYPLLRPFALGICIMFFPSIVLGGLNGILSPVVQGTARLLEGQTMDMNQYQREKDRIERESLLRNPETAFIVSDEEFDKEIEELGWNPSDMLTMTGMYAEWGIFNIKKKIRDFFRELLEILFQAAGFVIDTLRTFFLIVLAILGPLSFAISVWQGFQDTLIHWLTKYISVYLWLPVSDLFSAILARIQILMIKQDINQLSDPNFIPDSSNTIYIIFMIIGIVGYFTIPTVANWIVQANGLSGYTRKVNSTVTKAGSVSAGAAGASSGNITGKIIQ